MGRDGGGGGDIDARDVVVRTVDSARLCVDFGEMDEVGGSQMLELDQGRGATIEGFANLIFQELGDGRLWR